MLVLNNKHNCVQNDSYNTPSVVPEGMTGSFWKEDCHFWISDFAISRSFWKMQFAKVLKKGNGTSQPKIWHQEMELCTMKQSTPQSQL